MARRRLERLERVRGRRRRRYAIGGVALAAITVIAVAIVLATSGVERGPEAKVDVPETLETSPSVDASLGAEVASDAVAMLVEVPNVVRSQLTDARILLEVAGLTVVTVPTPPGEEASGTVLAQTPATGEKVARGSVVELVYADPTAFDPAVVAKTTASGFVVCLDPGHQATPNEAPEAVGPGSTDRKPKVTAGAVGAVTKQRESELALVLTLKIKERLERYGVAVVLTRVCDAVNISNGQRAQVAGAAGADLFVRVHADGSTNADTRGVSTLYAAGNEWVAPIEAGSASAAQKVHAEMLASTGAIDGGIHKRSDLAGFNWSTVPAILVEVGYLSNPVDDRALADAAYQDKLADGIVRGIMAYLEE